MHLYQVLCKLNYILNQNVWALLCHFEGFVTSDYKASENVLFYSMATQFT
jgi:hypothetical protein